MNDTTLPPGRRIPSTLSSSYPYIAPLKANSRAKVGVKRGFGLHNWVHLQKCSSDLAQRRGQPFRRIGRKEIAEHCTEHDCWISLHGKVYNLTPYLHYHPAGVDIFRSVYGKDASVLFDKYHRWVNVNGLIGCLLLGQLADVDVEDDEEEFKNNANRNSTKKKVSNNTQAQQMFPPRKKNFVFSVPSLRKTIDTTKKEMSPSVLPSHQKDFSFTISAPRPPKAVKSSLLSLGDDEDEDFDSNPWET